MTINNLTAALIAAIKANQTLIPSTSVFEGLRMKNIEYPCVCIELGPDRVESYSYPYEKIIQTFKVIVSVVNYNKDSQITDDSTTKGIGTLINTLKLAVSADAGNPNNATLNGQPDVYDVKIPKTTPTAIRYPVRDAILNVEVYYRQNRATRL